MPRWLDEFQAFRAVVHQANVTPEVWDYKQLVNDFIKRFEDAIIND